MEICFNKNHFQSFIYRYCSISFNNHCSKNVLLQCLVGLHFIWFMARKVSFFFKSSLPSIFPHPVKFMHPISNNRLTSIKQRESFCIGIFIYINFQVRVQTSVQQGRHHPAVLLSLIQPHSKTLFCRLKDEKPCSKNRSHILCWGLGVFFPLVFFFFFYKVSKISNV